MSYTDQCSVTATPLVVSAFQAYMGLTANSLNEFAGYAGLYESVRQSMHPELLNEEADWRARVNAQVLGFARLPPNWDSYHGKAPSLLTCVRALVLVQNWWQFAKRLSEPLPCPHVSAAGDGSISVEWSIGRKEVEVIAPTDGAEPFEWITTVNGPMGCEDRCGGFYAPDSSESRQLVGWLVTEK